MMMYTIITILAVIVMLMTRGLHKLISEIDWMNSRSYMNVAEQRLFTTQVKTKLWLHEFALTIKLDQKEFLNKLLEIDEMVLFDYQKECEVIREECKKKNLNSRSLWTRYMNEHVHSIEKNKKIEKLANKICDEIQEISISYMREKYAQHNDSRLVTQMLNLTANPSAKKPMLH